MRRSVRGRGTAGVLVAVLLLMAGLGVALRFGELPIRVSDFWPLDLAEPGSWLIDLQLADLKRDPALCRRVLVAPRIVASPVADKKAAAGCGWSNAYRLSSAGRANLEVGAVTCELAAGLALWIEHVVQPAARQQFGQPIVSIEHLGAYACRNIRGNPGDDDTPSEHATANALDVKGFRVADGRRVRVLAHWGGNSPEGRFLAEIHKGACRYFRVAIGPNYNAAHRDHFHFDRGRWWECQ